MEKDRQINKTLQGGNIWIQPLGRIQLKWVGNAARGEAAHSERGMQQKANKVANMVGVAVLAMALGTGLLAVRPARAFGEPWYGRSDRGGMLQVQFGRWGHGGGGGGTGRMRGPDIAAPSGGGQANRRPPGERMTPEERERLRREIREQGRDVYGKRPPPRPNPDQH